MDQLSLMDQLSSRVWSRQSREHPLETIWYTFHSHELHPSWSAVSQTGLCVSLTHSFYRHTAQNLLPQNLPPQQHLEKIVRFHTAAAPHLRAKALQSLKTFFAEPSKPNTLETTAWIEKKVCPALLHLGHPHPASSCVDHPSQSSKRACLRPVLAGSKRPRRDLACWGV